jgi:hypothetical protein
MACVAADTGLFAEQSPRMRETSIGAKLEAEDWILMDANSSSKDTDVVAALGEATDVLLPKIGVTVSP